MDPLAVSHEVLKGSFPHMTTSDIYENVWCEVFLARVKQPLILSVDQYSGEPLRVAFVTVLIKCFQL